jgi:hypothetical protein
MPINFGACGIRRCLHSHDYEDVQRAEFSRAVGVGWNAWLGRKLTTFCVSNFDRTIIPSLY